MLRRRTALVLAAAIALLPACGPPRATDTRLAGSERWFGNTTPPHDNVFRYNLGAEPELTDPSLAVGQSDGRVCRMLFQGLTREDPKTLEPLPGCAYRWDISTDGRTYVFHLRPGLFWSDGSKLTAEDFRWSWIRVLTPENAARYANLLYPIRNAEAFNKGGLKDETLVGVRAPDDSTVVVQLENPTAYFLYLVQFYTYLPVPRRTIEQWGARWTRPEHIVNNGPFLLSDWRQNAYFKFRRNPRFWNAASVKLDGVIAYSLEDLNTATNLYKSGVIDWNPSGYTPSQYLPYLRGYEDFRSGDYQGTYFYCVNVTRKPLDNVWVRRALNYAIDRDAIANDLLKKSRRPWGGFSPSGYPGYHNPPGIPFDPVKARACLARAGYPNGKGFPKVSILFNTSEDHRRIAEALQAIWKRELNIDVELSNQEWGSYLQATTALQYDIARRSWIGDFLDPVTFLWLGVTKDGNNRTGWSDPHYDALLKRAALETDAAKRFIMLAQAESLILADGPFLPIYHYCTNELVKPYVRGIYQNALDVHPLDEVWIDHDWQRQPAPVADAADKRTGASAR
jgi:ABC-type oligopeptide transport system substrate-binding subunit